MAIVGRERSIHRQASIRQHRRHILNHVWFWNYHLAQYNVAKLVAALDDPRLDDFRANLDRINQLGDRSPGFVWRHQNADGTSTGTRIGDDPLVVINYTVWESLEALFEYTYHSDHVEVFRRRRDWFEDHGGVHYLAMWWVPAGHIPNVEQAEERLAHLREHGPTQYCFTFKQRFDPPSLDEPSALKVPAEL